MSDDTMPRRPPHTSISYGGNSWNETTHDTRRVCALQLPQVAQWYHTMRSQRFKHISPNTNAPKLGMSERAENLHAHST